MHEVPFKKKEKRGRKKGDRDGKKGTDLFSVFSV
jgi:hypothetical protein